MMPEPPPPFATCLLVNHTVVGQIGVYLVQLAYALPISLLYLFVIFKILKKHMVEQIFSDAYFRIYVLDGVVSIILLVLDFGLTRPLIYVNPMCYWFRELFPEPTYLLTPYLFLFNYFQFAKIFSITLLSANRYICVAYPIFHKMFWKKRTNLIIVISLLAPVLCTFHLAISPTRVDVYYGESLLGYEKVIPFISTTFLKLLISIFAFLFILLTNLKTYQLTKKFVNQRKSLEHSLALSTIIISGVFVVYIIIQAILLIFSTAFLVENLTFGSFLKKFEFVCNDFYLMSSPIVLLIMNRRLREMVFQVAPVAPRNSSNTKNSNELANTFLRLSPSAKTLNSNVVKF